LAGDCLALPFADESFDLITIAFGLRNLSDRAKGLSEMRRVLRPGGRLIVLEFSQPYIWFRPFYYLYLRGVLPWVARWLTGDRNAYLYLGSSISEFPDRAGLVQEIEQSGFSNVQAKALTFSIVSLHEGKKE
jgi:demethylmenaquinone methyltransferase/2-methoxy-6-polyprenyl-1,4-benzoquinol methylase